MQRKQRGRTNQAGHACDAARLRDTRKDSAWRSSCPGGRANAAYCLEFSAVSRRSNGSGSSASSDMRSSARPTLRHKKKS